jgi:hypothetical protein
MKIFDYKFLILLGLSLVVYFIYREVEYLRVKVDKLEKDFKNKSDNLLTNKNNIQTTPEPINTSNELKPLTNKPILSLPKPLENIKQQETVFVPDTRYNLNIINNAPENILGKTSPKIINVDISQTKVNEQKNFESGVKLTTIVNKQKVKTDSESSSKSSSSKHLAIYSNDNEQYDETQNSLLESIESNKMELNFDYNNKIQMENIESNVNELINMVTSQDESEKSKSDTIEQNKSESIEEISLNNDKQTTSSDKLNEEELEKKKLPEIKKIAELHKISLTKKVNGQQKIKNKQELINEIMGKNI